MRVLVCGSRDFREEELLKKTLDQIHTETPITCVIEGEARGADIQGKHWAVRNKLAVLPYPADWDRYGKRAGYIRNQQMLVEGKPDLVVAFWDGQSRGTKMMIELAKKAGVPVKIVQSNWIGF